MADLRRKWSTIPKAAPAPNKQRHFTINRHVSTRVAAELARVLVRLNRHISHLPEMSFLVGEIRRTRSIQNLLPYPTAP